MPVYETDALILRTYKLGEADRIVVFLTRDRGKKRGVANGARRSRSRFAGALEPMTLAEVSYYEREHRDLVRLGYADPRRSPLTAARSDALHHVGYFAELIDEWAPEGDPNERLFRLGSATLDALAAGVPTLALARYFEYWLLRLQGVYPPHVACHRCGAVLDGDAPGAYLEPGAHVFTCGECSGGSGAGGGDRVVGLSGPALRFLASAARTRPLELGETPLPSRVDRELEAVHRALLRVHLERDLRSARVLREIGR